MEKRDQADDRPVTDCFVEHVFWTQSILRSMALNTHGVIQFPEFKTGSDDCLNNVSLTLDTVSRFLQLTGYFTRVLRTVPYCLYITK
jgi:hypothetical protein